MRATIDADAGVFTLINTFEVDPEQAFDVVASLRAFTEQTTRSLPGFVATAVHVSLDKKRVINYVQWKTAQDLQAMIALPAAQEHKQEVGKLAKAVSPVFYTVEYVCARDDS